MATKRELLSLAAEVEKVLARVRSLIDGLDSPDELDSPLAYEDITDDMLTPEVVKRCCLSTGHQTIRDTSGIYFVRRGRLYRKTPHEDVETPWGDIAKWLTVGELTPYRRKQVFKRFGILFSNGQFNQAAYDLACEIEEDPELAANIQD